MGVGKRPNKRRDKGSNRGPDKNPNKEPKKGADTRSVKETDAARDEQQLPQAGGGERLRLFLALPLSVAARREAGSRGHELRRRLPRSRWVPPENLHLTLVFLGRVEEAAVPALIDAVAPAFAACPGLTLRFAGGGTFPPSRPPKVGWVGVEVEEGRERLERLQAAVAEAAGRILDPGAPPPGSAKPWLPHLTLVRPKERWTKRDSARFAEAFRKPLAPAHPVTAGHLMQSLLGGGRGGAPEYRSLAEFPLGTAAEGDAETAPSGGSE